MADRKRLVIPSYFVGLGGFSKAVFPHLDAFLQTHYGFRPSCTPFTLFDFDGAGAGIRVEQAAFGIDPYLKELPKKVLLDYARKLRRGTKEAAYLRQHLDGYVDFSHIRAVEAPGLNLLPQNGNLGWRLVWETHVLPELLSKLQRLQPAPSVQTQLEREGILPASRSIIWVVAGGGSTTGPTGLIPILCELKRQKPPRTMLYAVIFSPRAYRDRSYQQQAKGRAIYHATLEQLLKIFADQGYDQPYSLDGYRITLAEEPFDQVFLLDGTSGGRLELQPDELAEIAALFLGKVTVGASGERLLGILGNCTPSEGVSRRPVERFDHLSSFSFAAASFPARTIQAMLATRVQHRAIDILLQERTPEGKTLGELSEPGLAPINWVESVRGVVIKAWQPLIDGSEEVPPRHLLERLDQAWAAAEQAAGEVLDETADQLADHLIDERVQRKAGIIEAEACRLSRGQGMPAAIEWLERRHAECAEVRQRVGRDLSRYADRTRHRNEVLEGAKHDWSNLLASDDAELGPVPGRLLLLAAGVCTGAALLWLFDIPWNSPAGMAALVIAVLVGLLVSRPVFRHLRRSRQLAEAVDSLTSAYKRASLTSFDERFKRKELDYYDRLQERIAGLRVGCAERLAVLRAQGLALAEREETLRRRIFEVPPTIKVLFREAALAEWMTRGTPEVPRQAWLERLSSRHHDPAWDGMDAEGMAAFAFLLELRAEDELYALYPDRETRLAFLGSLQEAAIGAAPGETGLRLNFAEMADREPQIHLFIELDNPASSELAQELLAEWSGTKVGVQFQQTSDPTMVTILGVSYGFPLSAQDDWPEIRTAFERVHANLQSGIYPVLLPERRGES